MENSKSQTIAKNTGFLFIRMSLVVIIGLYTSRIVLNTLGVSDFGIYNLVGTLVVMFSFFKIALTNASSRYITFDLGTGNIKNLNKTFSMCLNIHYLLAFAIIILSEIIGPWLIVSKLNITPSRLLAAQSVFQISLFSFVIDIIRTPYNSIVIAHEKMNFYAVISILEVSLKLLIVYLLVYIAFDKLILYSLLLLFVSIVLFIILAVYCTIHFHECKYHYCWDKVLFKELINYSGLSIIVNIADITVSQMFGIFFNIFHGVTANAALGIANQVNNQLNGFLNNFSQSYQPQIIKSFASHEENYFLKLIYSSSKFSYYLFFGVAFPIILNINYVLKIWLVNPPELTAPFLICIVLYSLFDSFSTPLWTAVYATGNLKVHQIIMFALKIINIPLAYIVLKLGYSLISPLIIYAFLNLICSVVRIIYLRYLINLDLVYFVKDVLMRILLISLITSLPVFLLSFAFYGLNKLIVSTLVFIVLYPVIIYFYGINIKEREVVNNLIKEFANKII